MTSLPNAAPDVERFLTDLDHPMASEIAGLRQAILDANPAITERIKWKAPSFCFDGDDRVTFRLPPKGGFQVVFHRGVKAKDATSFRFDDDTGLMQWAAPDRAVVTLVGADDLRAHQEVIVALITRWMRATT